MLAAHLDEHLIDAERLRATLGALASGVTVVTTQRRHAYGVTATAVSLASLNPPLALICIKRHGRAAHEISSSRRFAVNILADDQEAISRRFAAPHRPSGPAALRGISHRMSDLGSPLLDGVVGFLDCELVARHEAGDHVIFVGEVQDVGVTADLHGPLISHAGRYWRLAEIDRPSAARAARRQIGALVS
jgi:flavin reductase